ncbi:MAG: type II toxin-antitoxin system CcdA family antitoxin [Myxococcota bacterium]
MRMKGSDDTAKQPTNLSINSALLRAARERKINLSATLEQALRERIATAEREDWLAENADAFEEYDRVVAGIGVFGDSVRRF